MPADVLCISKMTEKSSFLCKSSLTLSLKYFRNVPKISIPHQNLKLNLLETAFRKLFQKVPIKEPFDSCEWFIWWKRFAGQSYILLLWFTDRCQGVNVKSYFWNILNINRCDVNDITTSNVIKNSATVQTTWCPGSWKKTWQQFLIS